jgi:hypothetical protein
MMNGTQKTVTTRYCLPFFINTLFCAVFIVVRCCTVSPNVGRCWAINCKLNYMKNLIKLVVERERKLPRKVKKKRIRNFLKC